MGGRGGGSPGGSGNWRTEVDSKMEPNRITGQLFATQQGERTWPEAHLLQNATEQARIENELRQIVKSIAGDRNWVRFPAIRDAMAKKGWNRARQDAAILGLAGKRDASVIPVANLKSLNNDDRRAAVRIGGEFKHAVSVGW